MITQSCNVNNVDYGFGGFDELSVPSAILIKLIV